MMTYEKYDEAIKTIVEDWGDAGKRVVERALHAPVNIPFKSFLDNCSACGGNWGGMLLTGIKRLRPEIWEAIPDKLGHRGFVDLCYTLNLMGIETED